jgi:hypothetical protein
MARIGQIKAWLVVSVRIPGPIAAGAVENCVVLSGRGSGVWGRNQNAAV